MAGKVSKGESDNAQGFSPLGHSFCEIMCGYSVIVLGSGAAGLRAALELKQAGLEVLVVSKGAAEASGATPSAVFSYCTGNPSDPANSVECFREDVLRSGITVNDSLMVDFLCRNGYASLQDLAHMGMPWTRNKKGDLDQAYLPGHSVSRAFHVGWQTGKVLSNTLLQACLKAGIRFAQYKMAVDFLINKDRIEGLVMLDWLQGEASVWKCDALILATGGAPAIYRLHTNPPGQTGDGMAMVLRAGGELVDMEFMQMYPTVLVFPPAVYGKQISTGRLLAAGALLLNRDGKDFFNRWETGPVGQATRDTLARAIAREIAAGGGTDAGGIYIDSRNVPQIWEQRRYVKFLLDLGVDLIRAPQQVAPGAHFSLGGVKVDPPASCARIEGAFAAGEVVGGVHGANRLAGNALTETQVFGALGARGAIEYLPRIRSRNVITKRVHGANDIARPLSRGESALWDSVCTAQTRSSGKSIEEMRSAFRNIVQECGGMVRTGPSLENGLAELKHLRQTFLKELALPPRSGVWHPELLKTIELANMLDVAQALLAGALLRTESRGSHFRDDYPERKKEFDHHNFLVQGYGEKMTVYRLHRECNERRQVWP